MRFTKHLAPKIAAASVAFAALVSIGPQAAAQSAGSPTDPDHPVAGTDDDNHIIGGTEAAPGEYPWAVRYRINNRGMCTGSLIREDLVLTAAHCVDDGAMVSDIIVGRSNLRSNEGEERDVASVVVHPEFDVETLRNDVALLRLREPVNAPTVEIASRAPRVGTDVRIIGYGRTGPDEPAATELREGDSEVLSDTNRDNPLASTRRTGSRGVMVALNGEAGTCPGDSGGPALVSDSGGWLQFGVNSWSPGGSNDCRPDVFADLTASGIRSWIDGFLDEPVAFGDFHGTGIYSILRSNGDAWHISSDGGKTWRLWNTSGVRVPSLGFGDFDGDGRTDVFRGNGREWSVSYGGNSRWRVVNTSGYEAHEVGFGDFDGDGRTDVFKANGRSWSVSYGATSRWTEINSSRVRTAQMQFVDLDGDGTTDVFYNGGQQWLASWGGASRWSVINER